MNCTDQTAPNWKRQFRDRAPGIARASQRPSARTGHQASSQGRRAKIANTAGAPVANQSEASHPARRADQPLASRSSPAIDDQARPTIGGNSQGAIARVELPRQSKAIIRNEGPTSRAR